MEEAEAEEKRKEEARRLAEEAERKEREEKERKEKEEKEKEEKERKEKEEKEKAEAARKKKEEADAKKRREEKKKVEVEEEEEEEENEGWDPSVEKTEVEKWMEVTRKMREDGVREAQEGAKKGESSKSGGRGKAEKVEKLVPMAEPCWNCRSWVPPLTCMRST